MEEGKKKKRGMVGCNGIKVIFSALIKYTSRTLDL